MTTQERPWRYSRHAQDRIRQMRLTVAEVDDCLRRPALRLRSGADYPGCMVYQHRRIAMAVNEKERVVVTVLWNRAPHSERFVRPGEEQDR